MFCLTTEPKGIQTIFGPFDLQKKEKHLIVDLLTLGANHDVNRPGHLKAKITSQCCTFKTKVRLRYNIHGVYLVT